MSPHNPTKTESQDGGDAPKLYHAFAGATHLYDQIARATGMEEDLKACFPDRWKKILTFAYYLASEDRGIARRVGIWGAMHLHPMGRDTLTRSDVRNLFDSISWEESREFQRRQAKRHAEEALWVCGATSLDSVPETLRQMRWGRRRALDFPPRLHLGVIFGGESGLPLYWKVLREEVTDLQALLDFRREAGIAGAETAGVVADHGELGAGELGGLFEGMEPFVVELDTDHALVERAIRDSKEGLRHLLDYDLTHSVCSATTVLWWDRKEKRLTRRPGRGGGEAAYLHLYYSKEKSFEDELMGSDKLWTMREELLQKRHVPAHEAAYGRYFTTYVNTKGKLQATGKKKAIDDIWRKCGYSALLARGVENPDRALELHRRRCVAEEMFSDMKGRFNTLWTTDSSGEYLHGKLFVEYLALFLRSYIRRRMLDDKDYFRDLTVEDVIDLLDLVECYVEEGKPTVFGYVHPAQQELYRAMGFEAPETDSEVGPIQ